MKYHIKWRKFAEKGKCFEDHPDKTVTHTQLIRMLKDRKVLVISAQLIYEYQNLKDFTF